MKAIMILGMALLSTMTVMAGNDAIRSHEGGGKHHCIMADNETWVQLGVTPEQMTKVNEVQEACTRDIETARAAGTPAEASVERHVEMLKSVLTTEQFMAWDKWCSEKHAAKPTPGTM